MLVGHLFNLVRSTEQTHLRKLNLQVSFIKLLIKLSNECHTFNVFHNVMSSMKMNVQNSSTVKVSKF